MTVHRPLPSEIDAEQLWELLEDARAIPAAAFSLPAMAARPPLPLGDPLRQPVEVTIPSTTRSIVEAAEHQWADFSRD